MYTQRIGHAAFRFLLVKAQREMTLYGQSQREKALELDYTELYCKYLEDVPELICKPIIVNFSNTLAVFLYGTKEEKARTNTSDCFLWMCFMYTACLFRRGGFDVSDNGIPKLLSYKEAMGVTEADLYELLREVNDAIWRMRIDTQQQHKLRLLG